METKTEISGELQRTRARADGIIIGMFKEYDGLESPYSSFSDSLINDDSLDSLRAQRAFKDGVQIVVNMADSLNYDKTGFEDYFLASAQHDGSDEDLKAVKMLLEALAIVEKNPGRGPGLTDLDVMDLRQDFETIIYVIEMVLKVKRSESVTLV
jgi:hypothetical protein